MKILRFESGWSGTFQYLNLRLYYGGDFVNIGIYPIGYDSLKGALKALSTIGYISELKDLLRGEIMYEESN